MLIAATGHRPNKLGGYGPVAYRRLVTLAEAYLRLTKPDGIITGMALGWDQAWADAGLNLGVPVHAAVPFVGQESQWPLESQANFKRISARCASVTIVSKGSYSAAKMQTRNEYMVDKADRICALWDGSAGGTGNCVRYAESVDKKIDNVWKYLDSPTKLQAIAINPLDIPCAAIYHPLHTLTEKEPRTMSIEELFKAVVTALEANTKAVNALEASLQGRTPSKSAEKADKQVGKAKDEPEPEIVEEKDPEPVEEKKPDVVQETGQVLPYETARALVLKLANAGKRAEIPQVFKAHGIDNLKKLLDKEDDFSTVNDQAKLEAVYADLQALEG